jgi:glutamate 5-kinase
VILSHVDGLLEGGQPGKVIDTIRAAEDALRQVQPLRSATGTGGMATKVEAALLARRGGVPTVIANGMRPGIVQRVLAGQALGTYFPTERQAVSARKRWLGLATRTRGAVVVDDGACWALVHRGSSLLPAGITAVEGAFEAGAPVDVLDRRRERIARGLVSYDSLAIDRIRGQKSAQIAAVLGYSYCEEVIHRNDLVLLHPGSADA